MEMTGAPQKKLCYYLEREDVQDMYCGSNIDEVLNTLRGELGHEFDTQDQRDPQEAVVFTLRPIFMTAREIDSLPTWEG